MSLTGRTICGTVLAVCSIFPWTALAKQGMTKFSVTAKPPIQSKEIDYGVDQTRAQFFVYVPDNYSGSEDFGLIVYTSPVDSVTSLPNGWAEVLKKRKLLFVAAQGVGNESGLNSRRFGLAVVGALGMMGQYKVDPKRVYAAGLSGGARVANDLGFYQPDIFRGTISDCGSDYFRPVPKVAAHSEVDSLGNVYGVAPISDRDVSRARGSTKFALITGSDDYRRGNILDIYNGGYARDGFQSRLFDIRGMGHQDCSAETLNKVVDFLDNSH